MKLVLIGIDRDGTLIEDPGYLGKDINWKDQLEILPGVVEGLRYLIGLRNMVNSGENYRIKIVVATNQAGVARGYFPLERAEEVNKTLDGMLRKMGLPLDGWYSCPFVGSDYAREKGIPLDNRWVKKTDMRKPGIGMLRKASTDFGFDWGNLTQEGNIYFIGDKLSDVETGLNANGTSIYVGENWEKIKHLTKDYPDRVHMARGFNEASGFIVRSLHEEGVLSYPK